EDLAKHTLLHDASRRDWQAYTRQLGLNHINVQQGPIFSHSAMATMENTAEARNADYNAAEKILTEQAPIAPIYQYTNGRLIKPW
ncbi:hypothetical protein ONQ60_27435, partial [Salmonella enterica subsp. enterica serovar Virginia]|nr:hypothetical protein [Salmonella enterica subsp. enterica serovar Virginia]